MVAHKMTFLLTVEDVEIAYIFIFLLFFGLVWLGCFEA